MWGEQPAAAEWRRDPTGRHSERWWDGRQWTDHVQSWGKSAVDAIRPDDVIAAPAPPLVAADWSHDLAPRAPRMSWMEGAGRTGAFVLAFGAGATIGCGFMVAGSTHLYDNFGDGYLWKFKMFDMFHGEDLIFPALLLLFFVPWLFREFPPRVFSWVATAIAVFMTFWAVKLRVAHQLVGTHDNGPGYLHFGLFSSLNLVIATSVIAVLGALWCVRAEGPIVRPRAWRNSA